MVQMDKIQWGKHVYRNNKETQQRKEVILSGCSGGAVRRCTVGGSSGSGSGGRNLCLRLFRWPTSTFLIHTSRSWEKDRSGMLTQLAGRVYVC